MSYGEVSASHPSGEMMMMIKKLIRKGGTRVNCFVYTLRAMRSIAGPREMSDVRDRPCVHNVAFAIR